jgi:FKBP-type peptidyl-prolyl cis-trans isomerase FkpA
MTMKSLAYAALGASLLGCGQAGTTGNTSLTTLEDSVSYVLGFQLGHQAKQQDVKLNPAVFVKALNEALAGGKGALTEQQMQGAMSAFQTRMMAAQRAKDSVGSIENEKAGNDFLAKNKNEAGVKSTASGLQYKVIQAGSGPSPKATSSVTVKYRGTLLDGTEFDSSGDRTVTFVLTGVIPGWTEGLQLMPKGAKYQFWIPGHLAYGPAGSPPRIGPNQTLFFEVEMVDFK